MGQTLIRAGNQVSPEAETLLLKYFPQFQFVKMLTADSIFLKSVLCTNENDGFPLVIKIYFKKEMTPMENNIYMKHVKSLQEIKEYFNSNLSPNIAPILIVNDSLQKAGLIIRQYFTHNLKDRMQSMPYLSNIEKKWISFQILYGLMQIHNKGVCHGNIKLENVLLSSLSSVFLCDMAPYKPAFIQEDDVGSFTYYFGKSSSTNSCYLAPERLVDKNTLNNLSNSNSLHKITSSMDIFSTGVVIAELFLEDILFDHQKLLLYKYGNFNLEPILSKIKDEKLQKLLINMLSVDPSKRNNISICLNYFAEEICPISFSRMYLHINNLLIQNNYWKPDKRIALIKHYWKQIWHTLFGKNKTNKTLRGSKKFEGPPDLYQNLNLNVLNKLLLDDPFSKPSSCGNHFKLIFNLEDDKELNFLRESDEEKLEEKENGESALILINLILQAILNTKYPSTKLCAMEMLRHLADNLPIVEKDLIKIQTIIPYLSKLFKDSSNLVKFSALNEVINILNGIDMENLILPSSDYNVFDAYIFPYILELYNSNEPSLILGFSNLIDKITDIENKFLQISMKSRFFNMKNLTNNNNNNSINNIQTTSASEISNSSNSINNNNNNNLNTYTTKTNIHNEQNSEYGFYSTSHVSKGEEIIQTYDTDLYEFKITLFKIMEDILSKNEEIDIQRLLIRKLANLINFTGRRETNIFTQFIISNFNRRDWIIHKEIFSSLPSLVINLGERHLTEYIIPCMDMMISNNLDEIKILEMIKSLHILLKMGYLETSAAIDLFKKILPFILHPNILIRNEVINFAETLIYSQNYAEIFTYLRPEFKKYFTMPFLIIKNECLKSSIKERLSRVIYEMNVSDVKYSFSLNFEDSEAHHLLSGFLLPGMKDKNKNFESERNILERQAIKIKNILEGKSVGNFIRKEFLKAIKNLKEEDYKSFEYIYVGKLISLSSIIESFYQSPTYKRRRSVTAIMSNNNNNLNNGKISDAEAMIYQDNFRVKFFLKSLNLAINDESCLDENKIKYRQNQNNQNSNNQNKNLNYPFMANWKPMGKLISTFYDHDNSTIEKLIPLPTDTSNKIISVGGDGKLVLYDFYDNEGSLQIDKVSETKATEFIQYNKAITAMDSNTFALGFKNKINIYKVDNFSNNIVQSYNIPEENENVNILNLNCYLRNNNNTENSANSNKTLVYTNQKGKIFVYDLRASKKVLSNNFGVHKGLFSAMDWGKDDKSLYISTYGGYVLNYDFRLNHIVESYKIYENTPITNIKTFIPSKLKDFEVNFSPNNNNNFLQNNISNYFSNTFNNYNPNNSFNNPYNNNNINNLGYNSYILLSTANGEHELSMWNLNNLNCEYLFKTNSISGKEQKPLITEIPSMSKINNQDFNKDNYENLYKNLSKLNFIRKVDNVIKDTIDSDFYNQANKRLSKISNIYSNVNSIQVICCPENIRLGDSFTNNNNIRENVPFILTAGNDMSIRYWDIRKEKSGNKSMVVNCPNKIEYANFNSTIHDKTQIIQSDEYLNLDGPKKNCPNFSDYQNKNGIGYHTAVQNEFVDNTADFLQFCTSLSDASHKDFISDLHVFNLNRSEKSVMVSSSWDGTMKVWK